MIIVQSTFYLVAETQDSAIQQMKSMAQLCVVEPGCLSYEYFQGVTETNQVVLLQEWKDEKSLQAHYQTEHMEEFVSKLGEYLESGVVSKSFMSQEEKFNATSGGDKSEQNIIH